MNKQKTYHNDLSNWVVGKVKRKYLTGSSVNIVDRTFYTSNTGDGAIGRVKTESEMGLSTRTYEYHNDGQLKKISWARDSINRRIIENQFQNYKRGIPRKEYDGNNKLFKRTVNASGTISSETDWHTETVDGPVGRTVSFGYDSVLRLTSISNPVYSDVNTVFTDSGRTKTAVDH